MRRITWLGHATVLLELGGARLLTDPLLRSRVAHLRRHAPVPPPLDPVDAVLISHVHHDHLDRPSLRAIARPGTVALCPPGATRWLSDLPFMRVHELEAGERAEVAGVSVRAVPAWHRVRRWPHRAEHPAIGFLAERVWFAGDTAFDPAMEALRGEVDVALLPIWGWGPTLGPGHLDPASAARAVALVTQQVVVPIHWGTLLPLGTHRRHGAVLSAPAHAFVAQVARTAPGVRVATLAVGDALDA